MAALIIALLLVFAGSLLGASLPRPDIAALRRHPRR